jgi:hypothetical protein
MDHPWLESSQFEQRYIPEPNTGCWLWTASLQGDGYGAVYPDGRRGKQWRAHRLAYVLFRGDIPEGMHVLHRCDTPACVNPDHLFLGTELDNSRDKMAKERDGLVGERNGRAKLTRTKVEEIRARRKTGVSQRELGEEFGVTQTTVSAIMRGVLWRDT